tara:strand:+ start:566 stop:1420 length:855 start_codon:yes stop_codon:yes gene_type:complete
MLVLTGTDGFIGRNILERFSMETDDEIITVDFKSDINPFVFLENLKNNKYKNIDTIIHNGACSDTTNCNPRYVMKHNFDYTRSLFNYCRDNKIRLIYASSASVYGDGPFREGATKKPKNLYALSKSMFDDYCHYFDSNVVGLRYFNVYGKYEENKKHMASVMYKFYNQLESGKIKLYENSSNYLRDFVHISDICAITMKIFKNKNIKGIVNVGTGKERSFLDIANIFVEKYNVSIDKIPMPGSLKDKYQAFTKSDNTRFDSLLQHKYLSLEEGIEEYLRYLEAK